MEKINEKMSGIVRKICNKWILKISSLALVLVNTVYASLYFVRLLRDALYRQNQIIILGNTYKNSIAYEKFQELRQKGYNCIMISDVPSEQINYGYWVIMEIVNFKDVIYDNVERIENNKLICNQGTYPFKKLIVIESYDFPLLMGIYKQLNQEIKEFHITYQNNTIFKIKKCSFQYKVYPVIESDIDIKMEYTKGNIPHLESNSIIVQSQLCTHSKDFFEFIKDCVHL